MKLVSPIFEIGLVRLRKMPKFETSIATAGPALFDIDGVAIDIEPCLSGQLHYLEVAA